MINIQRFRHVALVVRDLDRMVEFYTRLLGLKLKRTFEIESEEFRKGIGVEDAKAKGVHLMVPDSNVEIELIQFDQSENEETSVANMTGYRHIAFIVDDLEKSFETLKENGIEFVSEPITVTEPESVRGFQFVYFRDPEGNIVELNKLPEEA